MEKRHYELLLISRHIHDDKVQKFSNKYTSLIKKDGDILRHENWGVRPLAYKIDGLSRALYILINIYCPAKTIDELEKQFKFDDMVLRHMLVREKEGIEEESPIMKRKKQDDNKRANNSYEATTPPKEKVEPPAEVANATVDSSDDSEKVAKQAVDLAATDKINEVVDAAQVDSPAEATDGSKDTDVAQVDSPAEATDGSKDTDIAQVDSPAEATDGSKDTDIAQVDSPAEATDGSKDTDVAQVDSPAEATDGSKDTDVAQVDSPAEATDSSKDTDVAQVDSPAEATYSSKDTDVADDAGTTDSKEDAAKIGDTNKEESK